MLSFPFNNYRKGQKNIINDVRECLNNDKNLLLHAPTGLGKTIGVLYPALNYAIKNDLKIFFLTPRHTQQEIVYETVKKINEENNSSIGCISFLGKKKMCNHEASKILMSYEFANFCNNLKKMHACSYYENVKKLKKISDFNNMSTEEIMNYCKPKKLCSYEIVCRRAEDARVIIGDYYYVFNPFIRQAIFTRIKNELSNNIIIVDEAHNLSNRIRQSCSSTISTYSIKGSIKEAEEHEFVKTKNDLIKLNQLFNHFRQELRGKEEIYINKERFRNTLSRLTGKELSDIQTYLEYLSKEVYKENNKSSSHAISEFLKKIINDNKSRILIFRKKKDYCLLENFNMDPRIISKEVINNAHSVLLMSGTLKPLRMHQELLGFNPHNTLMKEYESSFPEENRLVVINDEFSTKYKYRTKNMINKMSEKTAEIVNNSDVNTLLFFPSYKFKERFLKKFTPLSEKTVFQETPDTDKNKLLKQFSEYSGAVLACVIGGSFSEGIDYPGKLAEMAIIIGVPFNPPDLKIKALIKYYDYKFNRGWDYAYTFPALNKAVQAGGRCIRSPDDKGVIILMDNRYKRRHYENVYPNEWNIKIGEDTNSIINFLNQNSLN